MKRSEIEAAARQYIGANWRHRGRAAHAMDCVGLLTLIANQFGVPYQDVDGYSRFPDGERLVDHLKQFMVLAPLPLKPAQVVILRDNHLPCHVGILVSRGRETKLRMVHASAGHRKVLEDDFDKWMPKFRLALDWPGIEEN